MNNFDKNKTNKNSNYNFSYSNSNMGNYSNNIILLDKKRAKNNENNKNPSKKYDAVNYKSFAQFKNNKISNNKNPNMNNKKSKNKNNNINNPIAEKKIMKKSSTYQILPK